MKSVENILDIIGNIPMLRLNSLAGGTVYAKAEFLNPGGSVKDRVARFIIEEAERDGSLKPGLHVIQGIGDGFVPPA